MLRNAGCSVLYVDKSFTTDKLVPSDWDGCFCTANLSWSKIDPLLNNIEINRELIKQKYKCDLYPESAIEAGSGKTFRQFFQQNLQGRPKGIIALQLRTVP